MQRILISLCTYNEHGNLRELVADLFHVAPQADILVIDDNSPDGTGVLADELAAADSRVHVLHRRTKDGLGTATLAGFRYAIQHQYDFLMNLDADFSHPPRFVPALLQQSETCDVVIGSRYTEGGGVAGWTWRRKLMSRLINGWARVMLGLTTADNSGSYRCYRVARLELIDWELTVARGYAFYEEVLYRCHRAGCRMAEVPIVFEDRRYGETKINWKECVAAVLVIFRLGLERLVKRRVLRKEVGSARAE